VQDDGRSREELLAEIARLRAQVERAQRESESLFRTMANAAPVLIWIAGTDKACNYFNEPWLDFTGRRLEDEVGRGWLSAVHPEDVARCMEVYTQAFDARHPFRMEYRLRRFDGVYRWLLDTGVPHYRSEGEFAGYIGSCIDISERYAAEEARRAIEQKILQAQKLESLGVLAGGIAHDFNNLLTGILGFADLAMIDLTPAAPARNHIEQVMKGARQAAELTQQMLAYSGKGRFVVRSLQLSQVVEEMSHLLQVSITKKCVLRYHFHPNLPCVEGDAAQLRQVMMNLIVNASEAIGERSGVIAVTTGAMFCDHAYLAETYLDDNLAEGLYVYVEIADTGCGMTEDVRKRIFDPFFTTKAQGRGLGMAAVLGIVRGHRGAVKVYSEPGRGSTVKILLPASAMPADIYGAAGDGKESWTASGTVLVVDDEETVRTVARVMLEKMGFTVLLACDGIEAVKTFREKHAHVRVVLLDMTMPHLDGEQTFRELRRIHSDVCVILSSGYNEQSATNRFAGKGLAGFLQKPYRFEQLRDFLRRLLGGADGK
jgi:two-component system, cell cycle sensor histidine kinase and response regulator CckA